jgi:hypothetical protein
MEYKHGVRLTPPAHELSPLEAAIERYAQKAKQHFWIYRSVSVKRIRRCCALQTAVARKNAPARQLPYARDFAARCTAGRSGMIYLIRNDGYKFQELDLEVNDLIDNFPEDIGYRDAHDFICDNLSLSQGWKPVETSFSPTDDAEAPIPDIAKWIDATLVLSNKAYTVLSLPLSNVGKFLRIAVGGEEYYLFNCLTCANVDRLHSKKSYCEGEDMGFETLVFEPTSAPIFKSPDQGCLDLFCDDSVTSLIEAHSLKGVIFDTDLTLKFD